MKLNNKEKTIFITSLIIMLFLGVTLTYNFDFKNNYNLLFDSDTSRVINDATEYLANHDRVNVHPLFVLLIQPLVYLLSGLVMNKTLSIIIISSLVTSISTLYIYKILNLFNKDNKINIILSMVYLFSFSNIIFTSGIETYNFAALFLILLWYYYLKKQKETTIDKYSLTILIILGLMNLSFTITNFVVYLIVLFILWISKKINLKQAIVVTIIPLILLVGLNIFQKVVWHNTPLIYKTSVIQEKNDYSSTVINKDTFKNVLVNDYYNSLISNDIELKIDYGINYTGLNYRLDFIDPSIINFILITIFYILLILLLVRNFTSNIYENICLILILGFNTCLHLIYGNTGAFLYSMHFLYGIILLFGINFHNDKKKQFKKFIEIFLYIFLIIELFINTNIYLKIIDYAKDILNTNYLVASFGLTKTIIIEFIIIVLVIVLVNLIFKLIKKNLSNEKKIINIVTISSILVLISLIFFSLENTKSYNKFLIFSLNNKSEVKESKTKIDYLDKEFVEYFKEEIESVKKYQKEYNDFKASYNHATNNDLNWSDYYFFGLGNRKKIYYKPNVLIDIETNEVLYSFTEKTHLLIPNEYSVIIETAENDYIKIKEDNEGVHFIKNGQDEIIKGTDKKINLYSFENEKYSNIKKVLYGEILFNIKDSKIYPNVIVYDNVWYRDAAITTMVLEKTNNLDLVTDWIDNIEEIYDKQNSGVEETDNLGELLYLISKSKNPNNELIDKIEQEAERLAESNKDGYYPYGKTDFGDQYLYQNLWYKLGIESIGREYKYDINSITEDAYSKMTWWSNYDVKDKSQAEPDTLFPYLTYAIRHKIGSGVIPINNNLYPLSWEQNASNAKYENYASYENRFNNLKISPLHSWTASEMLLFIIDETK